VGFGFQVFFQNVPQINFDILAYLPYFQKVKGVSDHDAVSVRLWITPSPNELLNALTNQVQENSIFSHIDY
jgi:hypothetical protein